MRKPLGIAIVGGLMVSQVLTLYTTPVVYLYLDRLRTWSARRKQRRVARTRHARIITPRRRAAQQRVTAPQAGPGAIETTSMAPGTAACGAAKSFRNASRHRLTLFAPG